MSASLQDKNKNIIRSYHERVWGKGDLAAIKEVWDPNAKVSLTDFDGTALDTVIEDAERYFSAFEDVSTAIHALLADGDQVVLHWATEGTHTGQYGDIAATNKKITMSGMDILTLKDGKITEITSMWDGLSVFEQMGVLTIG